MPQESAREKSYRVVMIPNSTFNSETDLSHGNIDLGSISNIEMVTGYLGDPVVDYTEEDVDETVQLISRYWHDSNSTGFEYAYFMVSTKLELYEERKKMGMYTKTSDGYLPNDSWYPSLYDVAQIEFESGSDFTWSSEGNSSSGSTKGRRIESSIKAETNSSSNGKGSWLTWIPKIW